MTQVRGVDGECHRGLTFQVDDFDIFSFLQGWGNKLIKALSQEVQIPVY